MPEDRLDKVERILEQVSERLDKVAKEQEEFTKEMRQLSTAQAKTDEYVKNLGKTVGDLTGGWGKFIEGIALPAVMKLTKQINLKIEKRFWHVEGKSDKEVTKKECCEVDLLLTGKIDSKDVLLAVEIKSTFDTGDATDFLEILEDFYAYFSEFSKYQVIGAVAASRFGDGTDIFLLKKGIYVLRPSDGMLEIIKPKEVAVFPKNEES